MYHAHHILRARRRQRKRECAICIRARARFGFHAFRQTEEHHFIAYSRMAGGQVANTTVNSIGRGREKRVINPKKQEGALDSRTDIHKWPLGITCTTNSLPEFQKVDTPSTNDLHSKSSRVFPISPSWPPLSEQPGRGCGQT